MSRKDYIAIAEIIRQARYTYKYTGVRTQPSELIAITQFNAGLDKAVLALVEVLEADNPRFNKALFLSACEYAKIPRWTEVA
jgi:hypothetical protein